jgi:hypothetical protein
MSYSQINSFMKVIKDEKFTKLTKSTKIKKDYSHHGFYLHHLLESVAVKPSMQPTTRRLLPSPS